MPQYVDSSGRLYDVDEGSEREAAAQGLKPATDVNVQEHNQHAKYGSTGQAVQAFGEGAARAVTGIPGMVRGAIEETEIFNPQIEGLTYDEPDYGSLVEGFGSEEDIRGRQAENPLASAAGGAAAEIGMAVATGGLSRAAIAAEAVAGGALGAQEMAFQEDREFVHEDIGKDVTNLAVLSGLGMVLGAAPAVVGAVRKRVGRKATAATGEEIAEELGEIEAQAQARAAASEAPVEAPVARGDLDAVPMETASKESREGLADGVVQSADRRAMKSEADDIVEQASQGAALPRKTRGIKGDAELARNSKAIQERAVRELRDEMNALNKNKGDLNDGAMRRADVSKNISKNKEGQVAAARNAAVEVSELVGRLKGNADELGQLLGRAEGKAPGKHRPKFEAGGDKLVGELHKAADGLANAKTGEEAFHRIDALKRMMQKKKKSLEAGAKNAHDNSGHHQLIEAIEPIQERIRKSLEMEDVWGEMAKFQRARNKTFHDKLIPNSKAFNQSYGSVLGKDYNANLMIDAVEEKIESLIKNPTHSGRRYVSNMLEALEEMAATDAEYSIRAEGTKGTLDSIAKIRRTFELTDEVVAATDRFEALQKVPGVGGLASEAIAGGLIQSFRRLGGSVDTMVDRSIDEWIDHSIVKGAGPSSTVKRRVPRKVPELPDAVTRGMKRGLTRSMALFMQEDSNPATAFRKRSEQLLDEDAFIDKVTSSYDDLSRISPQASMMLTRYAFQAREFLLARRPAAVAVSMSNPKGYPPSVDAIADWATYVNAVSDPTDLIRRLGTGDIQAAEVEVLKNIEALRPVYEDIQMRLIEKFSNVDPRTPVDDQMLMRMDLLFDLDGAGSGAFSARAANAAKGASPRKPQQKGGRQSRKPSAEGGRMSPPSIQQTGATYGTEG